MADYPVKYDVAYPETLSRGLVLLRLLAGWAYVGIPHGFCLAVYGAAVGVVLFAAWWVALFTGKYPRGMFDFITGFYRWHNRVQAYLCFMTDVYPPFSNK